MRERTLIASRVAMLATVFVLVASAGAGARLLVSNNTPFPSSQLVVGARWTSQRLGPPSNQWGDILPTVWADDGNQYAMIDDGGADVPVAGGLWRQSVARITGTPPGIQISHVGDPRDPPPVTWGQISRNPKVWKGPLGPFYSSGLVEAGGDFFATQENNWNWNANGGFTGLQGIAYSTDYGQHWHAPLKPFPAPLGNLNWVVRRRGGWHFDGYQYAIASEREFNASQLILGRARPGVASMTDPSQWRWATGWRGPTPVFGRSLAAAVPILSWASHITYPQISYDDPIHRYLLTFTYSYAAGPPGIWRNGAELVILEAPHPWGPFRFVAREPYFGPSNGYGPGFPIKWISADGRSLWLKWAANFDGCAAGLDCSGGYGFNYRRLQLKLANG